MRLILAFQCFFAVLFGRTVPPRALPAPVDDPKGEEEQGKLAKDLETRTKDLEEARARVQALEKELGEAREAGDELSAAEATAAEAREEAEAATKRLADLERAQQAAAEKLKKARDDGALALLAWLQREGRLIDFLMEEIESYEDEEVGAAVRAIHKGCKKVLQEGLDLEAILKGEEEERVEVEAGFDPVAIQLTGNVRGDPPFKGTLMHKGWRTTRVAVPVPETVDTHVLAAAEVEL